MTEKPTYEELEKRIQELEQSEYNRKHSEEKLIHSYGLMDYIISHTRSAIAVFDRDLKYIYVSKRYLKDYRVKEKNIIGKHHYEVFTDIPQKWKNIHQRSLAGEVLSAEEDPYYRKDGSVNWTRWECRPWYESDGLIGGIIIYNEIINERMKIEAALRKSEQLLSSHLLNTPVGAISWDLNFNTVEWNPAAETIFGYTKEEAIGKHVAELLLPEDMKELVGSIFQNIIIEKGGAHSINENITKNGRRIICDWYNTAQKDTGGKVVGIASLVSDITERKQAEAALKESENKYRNLFESSIDAILLFDQEKGYLDCNPTVLALFGIQSKKQFLRLNPADLSPKYQPDGELSSEKAAIMIKKAFETGSNLFEWTHKRLNGEVFYTSVLVTCVKIGGRIILQETIRDISNYKRTQEMMIQSEKMLSVGGLAAGMAHEINNPLAGMIQNASVISNRLINIEMPANLKAAKEVGINMNDINAFMEKRGIGRMLTAINESGQRMAAIVDNMLSFARKSDARASFQLVSDLLDKTLELAATDFDLKKHYDFKKIAIKKEYEKNVPSLPCQAQEIQQVLLNILKNGAQAMQEARVKKPLFTIRTRFEKDRKMVCVEIEDNGPGMNEKIRKRVFEPFYTTKPAGVGTGLGLSVSYFIITENHDGEMSVESALGSGAKFIIRLPYRSK